MKQSLLIAAIFMVFGATAQAGSCPTGNSLTPDQMAAAMVNVFKRNQLWTAPGAYPYKDPKTGENRYYAIVWLHQPGAEDPVFMTWYKKNDPVNGERFFGPGENKQRTIEVTEKSGGTYQGWLKINSRNGLALAFKNLKLNATQKEVVKKEGAFVKVKLSSIKFSSRGGSCVFETITDSRYQGFGDILPSYKWQKPLNQL